jgi:hypothetical protein
MVLCKHKFDSIRQASRPTVNVQENEDGYKKG